MSPLIQLIEELEAVEKEANQKKDCRICFGKGYWRDENPMGYDNIACFECNQTGLEFGISDEAFTQKYRPALRALLEIVKVQQEALHALKEMGNDYSEVKATQALGKANALAKEVMK